MSVLLVCSKERGNTFDVCNYISNNIDVDLLVINKKEINDLKKYKSIILCSGVYLGAVHKNLLEFIAKIDKTSFHKDAKIYLFLTWFGRGKSDKTAISKVKYALEKKNLNLAENYFSCFGGKGPIRNAHPDKDDFNNVLNWIKSTII